MDVLNQKDPYLVTHIWDHNMKDLSKDVSNLDLIKILSIRRNIPVLKYLENKEDEVIKNTSYKKKVSKKKTGGGANAPSNDVEEDNQFNVAMLHFNGKLEEEEMEMVKKIVKGLDPSRAQDYTKWKHLGLCLHNICQSKEMMDLWKDFSSQSDKYVEHEHNSLWQSFADKPDGMKMGTLWRWLKEENEMLFDELRKDNLYNHVMRCVKFHGHDSDIAAVLFEKYKDKFVCVNPQKQVWYEFKEHRWHELDGACPTLRNKISDMKDGLPKEFFKVQKVLAEKCSQLDSDDQDNEDVIAKLQDQIAEIKEICDSKRHED